MNLINSYFKGRRERCRCARNFYPKKKGKISCFSRSTLYELKCIKSNFLTLSISEDRLSVLNQFPLQNTWFSELGE